MNVVFGRRRGAALLVVTAAFLTGVSVSPAAVSGAEADGASICSALPLAGQNTFGFATLARGGSASRGEPGGMGNETFVATPKGQQVLGTTIPVYFHVLRAGPSYAQGNIKPSTINRQIDVLNRAFAGGYGGASSPFQFELVAVDYTTNAEWFNMSYQSPAEREAKTALHRGGANALNIYSGTAGANLGWATWPWAQKEHPERDGIVIDFDSMPGGNIEGFNLGHTATHEAGHWFGMYHTFQGGCSASGDGVADTPAMKVPTSGCPEGKDTCTNDPGVDPIHNYMDYSTDPCYSEFSQGQVERAVGFFTQYRQ